MQFSDRSSFFFLSERKIALFLLVQRDASLVGHVMSTTSLVNDVACSLFCTRDRNCKSFNYYREQGICELNKEKTANNVEGVLVPYRGVEYYEKMELNQWSIKIYFAIFHADLKRMIKSGRHIPNHLWKIWCVTLPSWNRTNQVTFPGLILDLVTKTVHGARELNYLDFFLCLVRLLWQLEGCEFSKNSRIMSHIILDMRKMLTFVWWTNRFLICLTMWRWIGFAGMALFE